MVYSAFEELGKEFQIGIFGTAKILFILGLVFSIVAGLGLVIIVIANLLVIIGTFQLPKNVLERRDKPKQQTAALETGIRKNVDAGWDNPIKE
jgi:uncharacterized membrane protein